MRYRGHREPSAEFMHHHENAADSDPPLLLSSKPHKSSQGKIIPYFLLRELPKSGLNSPPSRGDAIFWRWNADDTNFNRLFRHLAFESFLERKKGSVDSIFQRYIVVVSVCSKHAGRGWMVKPFGSQPPFDW